MCAVAIDRIRRSRAVNAAKKPLARFFAVVAGLLAKLRFAIAVVLIFIIRLFGIIYGFVKKELLIARDKAHDIYFRLKGDCSPIIESARRLHRESALTFSVFAVIVCSLCILNFGLEVTVNGQKLGTVSNQMEFERIMRSVESSAAVYLNHPYLLSCDVDYRFKVAGYGDELNVEKAESFLFSCIDDIAVCSVLRVDGQVVAACDSESELRGVLDQILSEYEKKNGDSKVGFVEEVKIDREPVSKEYIADATEIKRMLTAKKTTTGSYIVQKGDTLSGIALKCGISTDNLREINQGINPNKIKIGQSLETSYSVAMLSIQETARITYTEKIAYDKRTEKNDAMYTNERKTIVSGKYGEKQITADVTYLDGVETGRVIIEEKTVKNPVTQVEYVGTKKPPAKSATGTFRRPYGGYISSNYGYRGREFHTGVDFAGPTGSTIVAADGGKVTFAGRNGNYGKCVIIKHSTGLETLYAHCSSLLVQSGESVAKGQQIAKVGSTGRATGPHVHFEVRVNGKHVSPWKYIK